jgi:hypothetical protein
MSVSLYSRTNKVYFRSYLFVNIVAPSAYIFSFLIIIHRKTSELRLKDFIPRIPNLQVKAKKHKNMHLITVPENNNIKFFGNEKLSIFK